MKNRLAGYEYRQRMPVGIEDSTGAVLFQFSRTPQFITTGPSIFKVIDLQDIYITALCEPHCKGTKK